MCAQLFLSTPSQTARSESCQSVSESSWTVGKIIPWWHYLPGRPLTQTRLPKDKNMHFRPKQKKVPVRRGPSSNGRNVCKFYGVAKELRTIK